MRTTFSVAWFLAQALSTAIAAEDPFRHYRAGLSTDVWTIANRTYAPWSDDDMKRQKEATKVADEGGKIVFRAKRIEAPAPLACETPKYEFKTVSTNDLVHGTSEEPPFDARLFGFGGKAKDIVMLDTGCGTKVYFADPYKAVFLVDGVAYGIERDPARGGRPDDRDRMQACFNLVAENTKARGPTEEPFLSETPTAAGRLDAAAREARLEIENCVGAIAYPCINAGTDNDATRSACYDRERAFWDNRLNDDYRRLIASSEASVAASYRTIQRAWISYRDARCAHSKIEFQGTMANPLQSYCLMKTTATQSLWLASPEIATQQ
jgi:uncharacterized protein YecT (DUF1311 family)